jgi:hypothetical protein
MNPKFELGNPNLKNYTGDYNQALGQILSLGYL